MDHLLTTLLLFMLGIPVSYIVGCLLLEEKISHEGPFKIPNVMVKFPTGHVQKAALFDRIRKLFGLYRVDLESAAGLTFWVVRRDRYEYFSCPFCLSFWVAFPFSIAGVFLTGLPVIWIVPVHFGIAAVSRSFHRRMWEE